MAWLRFADCTIEKVEISERFPDGIAIYILNDELKEKLNEPYKLTFWPTTENQIQQLVERKRERCYFANGMQDIDIYRSESNYVIRHSPHEMDNRVFILKDGQIEKVLAAIQ